jgi:hypothetical protein
MGPLEETGMEFRLKMSDEARLVIARTGGEARFQWSCSAGTAGSQ